MSSRSDGLLSGKTMDEPVPDVVTEIATALSASGPDESFEARLGLKMTIWLSEYDDYWAGVATVKAVADAGFLEGAIKNLQKSTVAGWRKEMEDTALTPTEQEERIALYSKIFGAVGKSS